MPGRIPRERGTRERFARAVDQGATHLDDQEFADELAVVAALRRAGTGVAPGEQGRMRIATRIADANREPEPILLAPVAAVSVAGQPPTQIPRPRIPEPEPNRPKPRLTAVLAGAFCLVLALAGLGAVMSTDSLPGDLLYQVKRAQESASLQFTLDEEDRARQRLEYAGDRLTELARLAERAEPGTGQHGFRVALADFGSDARIAVAQMTMLATSSDGSQLDLLRDWAATQSDRLSDLQTALPAGVTEDRARTATLLRDIDARAAALNERMTCYQITSGRSDELGVLPSEQTCGNRPGNRAGTSMTPRPSPDVQGGTGTRERADLARPDDRLTRRPTGAGDSPVTTTKTFPSPLPVTSGYEPRQWVPAPPATPVSRPRMADSVPDPPAKLSVPPVLPGLPGVGVGRMAENLDTP